MYRFSRSRSIRYLTATALLSAVASVLMMLEFNVPFMPSFIKMDLSELPALIAAFALGPTSGVLVCLIKNLVNVTMTMTGGVGELCNFLMGVCFVLPAGFFYRAHRTRRAALLASVAGAVIMAIASVPLNYFIIYPIYARLLPLDTIIGMYRAILPGVGGLLSCLLIFNLPFTLVKGLLDTLIAFLVYKPVVRALRAAKLMPSRPEAEKEDSARDHEV